MANPGRAKRSGPAIPARTVHRIKVTLAGSSPPIWRRLEVPSTMTLHAVHEVIQVAFGWEGYHLWVFEHRRERYGIADAELSIADAAARRLDQLASRDGDRLRYTYDFGDDWRHDIVVETVAVPEPDVAYPRCITGRRAGPPEDCGGVWGYDDLLGVLADPGHEDHRERLDWLGLGSASEFDPAAFSPAQVNAALSGFATVLLKD